MQMEVAQKIKNDKMMEASLTIGAKHMAGHSKRQVQEQQAEKITKEEPDKKETPNGTMNGTAG